MSLKKLDHLISRLEHTKSKMHSGGDIKDFVGGARRRRRITHIRRRPMGSGALTGGVTRRRRPIGSGALTGGFTLPKLKRLIGEVLKNEMSKKGGVIHRMIKAHTVRISKYAPRQATPVVLGRRRKEHGGTIQDFTGSGLTGGKRHYRKRTMHAGTIQNFMGEGLTGGIRRRKTIARKKGGAVPSHLNAWTSHVQDVRRAYPELSFKEALQVAKKSYR